MAMSEYYDEELEEIKRKKLEELQRRLLEEQRRRQEEAVREAQVQAILRRILTPKARERLNNLKLVKPEIAKFVEEQVIALAQSGRVPLPIDDDTLKRILEQVYRQTHREIKVRIRNRIIG